MTPEQFAYWLQGFTELSPDMEPPTAAQWTAIKEHLQTVFVKVTPPVLSEQPSPAIAPDYEQWQRMSELLRKAQQPTPAHIRPQDQYWPQTGFPPGPGSIPVTTC